MKYEEGSLKFKGLVFSWKLITTEQGEHGDVEVFNIEVLNEKTGYKLRQEFKNSVMERETTKKLAFALKEKMYFTQLRNYIRPKMWAGYDKDLNDNKIKTMNDLIKKRIYWLLLGVIVDFGMYINFEDYYSNFEDFCDNFGYEKDSRKAETIYKSCLDYSEKINSLKMDKKTEEYFKEEAKGETDNFIKNLKTAIQGQ